MARAEYHAHLGEANILANVHDAMRRAKEIAAELDLDQQRELQLSNRRAED
jgi:hypothetical protein